MIGIVAGSFDPITNGHVWLIKKAAEIVGPDGVLHVVMGVNSSKKYRFSAAERAEQIQNVLLDNLMNRMYNRISIKIITDDLLISTAKGLNATHIFRGIRNTKDFDYECEIQSVNRDIDSSIETVYLVPPPELVKVSSSTVKGLVGFKGWEDLVGKYLDPYIVSEFKRTQSV